MTPDRRIKCINEDGAYITFNTRYTPFLLLGADGLYGYDINVNTSDGTMLDGSTYIGSIAKKRNIILDISDKDAHWSHRMILYNVFRKGQKGKLIYYDGNIERQIEYYVEKVDPGTEGHARTTSVSLICPDPYFYATEDTNVAIGIFIPEFEFPFEIVSGTGIEFGAQEEAKSAQVDIGMEGENLAAVDGIGITITIAANNTVVNPRITYTRGTSESRIAFTNLTMSAGDVLVITTGTGNKRVRLNGANIINKMTADSVFIQLHKGTNIIAFAADTGAEYATMTATYRMKYGCV